MLSVAEHGSKPRVTLFATVQSTDKAQSAKSAAFAEQNRQLECTQTLFVDNPGFLRAEPLDSAGKGRGLRGRETLASE